jgi:hypothetical protein
VGLPGQVRSFVGLLGQVRSFVRFCEVWSGEVRSFMRFGGVAGAG